MDKYDDVTVKKEKGVVILTDPGQRFIMSRKVFRAIVADNVKEVMKGNSTITESPDNITVSERGTTMVTYDYSQVATIWG